MSSDEVLKDLKSLNDGITEKKLKHVYLNMDITN